LTLWIGILVALLILNVLVILHEFGHYIAARLFGVTAFEFGVGFPPNIFTLWTGKRTVSLERLPYGSSVSLRRGQIISLAATRDAQNGVLYAQKIIDGRQVEKLLDESETAHLLTGKTRAVAPDAVTIAPMAWSLNLLPLGGFVKLLALGSKRTPGNLNAKPYWAQITILLAGVLVNAVAPFAIMTINAWLPTEEFDVSAEGVAPTSAAERGGLLADDIIVSIDGASIDSVGDLGFAVASNLGGQTDWVVRRDGVETTLQITPERTTATLTVGEDTMLDAAHAYDPTLNEGDRFTRGFVGVRPEATARAVQEGVDFFGGFAEGFWRSIDLTTYAYNSVLLISQRQDADEPIFIGPVGLGQATGDIVAANVNWAERVGTLLLLAALISLSLAFFNALPLPPLDGGKILFVVLEILNRGKPISARAQNAVNLAGFLALMLFAAYVFLGDITRIISG